MIKGIIFDFDGPIMTGEKKSIWEKHEISRGLEKGAIKDLIRQYWAGAHQGEFKDITDFFKKTKPSLKISVDEVNGILEEMHATKKLNLEMIDLILSLKSKYKIALLSNFTADLNRFLKDMFNIYHLFDVVVNSYDIKFKKPYAQAFSYTLDKLGLNADEVIFTDDNEKNIEGARKVGIRSIHYKDFKQFKNELYAILEN